jgi:hypothetical protein
MAEARKMIGGVNLLQGECSLRSGQCHVLTSRGKAQMALKLIWSPRIPIPRKRESQ